MFISDTFKKILAGEKGGGGGAEASGMPTTRPKTGVRRKDIKEGMRHSRGIERREITPLTS